MFHTEFFNKQPSVFMDVDVKDIKGRKDPQPKRIKLNGEPENQNSSQEDSKIKYIKGSPSSNSSRGSNSTMPLDETLCENSYQDVVDVISSDDTTSLPDLLKCDEAEIETCQEIEIEFTEDDPPSIDEETISGEEDGPTGSENETGLELTVIVPGPIEITNSQVGDFSFVDLGSLCPAPSTGLGVHGNSPTSNSFVLKEENTSIVKSEAHSSFSDACVTIPDSDSHILSVLSSTTTGLSCGSDSSVGTSVVSSQSSNMIGNESFFPLNVSVERLDKIEDELRANKNEIKEYIRQLDVQIQRLDDEHQSLKSKLSEQRAIFSAIQKDIDSQTTRLKNNDDKVIEFQAKVKQQGILLKEKVTNAVKAEMGLRQLQWRICQKKLILYSQDVFTNHASIAAEEEKVKVDDDALSRLRSEERNAKEVFAELITECRNFFVLKEVLVRRINELKMGKDEVERIVSEVEKSLTSTSERLKELGMQKIKYLIQGGQIEKMLIKILDFQKLKAIDQKIEGEMKLALDQCPGLTNIMYTKLAASISGFNESFHNNNGSSVVSSVVGNSGISPMQHYANLQSFPCLGNGSWNTQSIISLSSQVASNLLQLEDVPR